MTKGRTWAVADGVIESTSKNKMADVAFLLVISIPSLVLLIFKVGFYGKHRRIIFFKIAYTEIVVDGKHMSWLSSLLAKMEE